MCLQTFQVVLGGVLKVDYPIQAATTINHCSTRGELLCAQRREFNKGVEQGAIHREVIKLLSDPAIMFLGTHNLADNPLRFLDTTLSKDHSFFNSTSMTSISASSEITAACI